MIVIDNFDPNIEETVKEAKNVKYTELEFQDIVYKGVAFSCMSKEIKAILEKKLQGTVEEMITFYRYYTKDLKSNNYIHADINFAGYIGVHFLHEELKGGFATWSHKETGLLEAFPHDSPELLEKFRAESNDEDKWRQEILVNSRYNRVVIYEASKFHSHYPKYLWGTGPKDGRLVQVFFFDLIKE